MNLTELEKICIEKSLKVYYAAIDSIKYNLFPVTRSYVEQVISFEVEQELGGAILKKYLNNNKLDNSIHIKIAVKHINKYKERVIKGVWKYAREKSKII